MKKEYTISGLILFFMGCFIIYTGRFSFAPGMAISLGKEKYFIAFIFFTLSGLFIYGGKKIEDKKDLK